MTESRRFELLAVAGAMLADEIDLVDGVRKLCALRFSIGDPDNEVFIPIRSIVSETDHFPVGVARSQYSEDYLRRMDSESESYFADARKDILDACRGILRAYS